MGVGGELSPNFWKTSPIFPSWAKPSISAFEPILRGWRRVLYFAVATAYQHEIYLIDELLSVGRRAFSGQVLAPDAAAAAEWAPLASW
jgi:hypothetical protein